MSQEYRNQFGMAVLKDDGSVVTWGGDGLQNHYGNDSSGVEQLLSFGVSQIFSNSKSFAAIKEDGSVVTWGDQYGGGDSSMVSNQLSSGVKRIFSTRRSYTALKEDGSVVIWGGGLNVYGDGGGIPDGLSGITDIFTTDNAFAALRNDGSVVSWGESEYGGDSLSVVFDLLRGVVKVQSNNLAFAALKNDGSVVTWGDSNNGGNSSTVAEHISSGVVDIFSTRNEEFGFSDDGYAFAALKNDGSVVTWGGERGGDSSEVGEQLGSDVIEIVSNKYGFAALKQNGSVVTWGNYDGPNPQNYLSPSNNASIANQLSSDIINIVSNHSSFAGLKNDGSVVTWGYARSGGDSSTVEEQLSDINQIFSVGDAFIATKEDDSIVYWGGVVDRDQGPNANNIDFTKLSYTTRGEKALLKEDGSVLSFGRFNSDPTDLSTVSDKLSSGIVGFVDPSTNEAYFDTKPPLIWGSDGEILSSNIINIEENQTIIHKFNANEVVFWSINGGNDSSLFTISNDGLLSFVSAPDYENPNSFSGNNNYEVEISASDFSNARNSTVQNLEISISNINDPIDTIAPIIYGPTAELNEDGAVLINEDELRIFSFTSNEPVSWSISGGPDASLFNISDEGKLSFLYAPDFILSNLEDDHNDYEVVIQAKDESPLENITTETVLITIEDRNGPILENAIVNYEGNKIILSFDEVLNDAPLSVDSFEILINDVATQASSLDIIGDTLEITPNLDIPSATPVSISYTGQSNDETNLIRDLSGNESILFSNKSVRNLKGFEKYQENEGTYGQRSAQEFKNHKSFAVLKSDGSVITWGDSETGGNSSAVSDQLSANVIQIFSNNSAYAALKNDGSVVTWGDSYSGGDSSDISDLLNADVSKIFSTRDSFAAIKEDGSVINWGGGPISNISDAIIVSETESEINFYKTRSYVRIRDQLLSEVKHLFSNEHAFAALKEDGSVVTWGRIISGGKGDVFVTPKESENSTFDVYPIDHDLANIYQINSTSNAFAALKIDGSVISWGHSSYGGDSSEVYDQLSEVSNIFATDYAFAALKQDGSVVTWGHSTYGGVSSEVSDQLSGVTNIFATDRAFAALKEDGSVITWGDSLSGGESSEVSAQLLGVTNIFATDRAFAALKDDGSVVTWGSNNHGGDVNIASSIFGDSINRHLSSGVVDIFSNEAAFAALKDDGSVISWGDKKYGGQNSYYNYYNSANNPIHISFDGHQEILSNLSSKVIHVYSNNHAFAALKEDGSVVTWGDKWLGGKILESISDRLNSGVVGFADNLVDDIYYSAGSINKATISGDIEKRGVEDGGHISGTLNAFDLDGLTDGNYFSISTPARSGTANINSESGEWTYNPKTNFNGEDQFRVTVTDDFGGRTTEIISLVIDSVDDEASITGDFNGFGQIDNPVIGTIIAVDPVDKFTDMSYFSLKTNSYRLTADNQKFSEAALHGTAEINQFTGVWTYNPDDSFIGNDSFIVLITDDDDNVVEREVSVTINNDENNQSNGQPNNNEIIDSNNSSSTDELENNIQENIPNSEKLAQDLIGFDVEWSRILKESHLGDSTDNNLTLVNKYGRGVASDNDGSIFIVGYESSENDFNKKSYFSKLSSGGEQEWEKLFTSSNNSDREIIPHNIITSDDGSIYIVGYSDGNFDETSAATNHNAFLRKYDNDGNHQWTQLISSNQKIEGHSIVISEDNSVFIVGYSEGDINDGEIINTNIEKRGTFVSKFSKDGVLNWTSLIGDGTREDWPISPYYHNSLEPVPINNSIAIDSEGSLIVTSTIYEKSSFLDDSSENIYKTNDILISKINSSSGEKVSSNILDSGGNDYSTSLAVGLDDSIYIAGITSGNFDEQPAIGGKDSFLTKFNSQGEKQWTKLLGLELNSRSNIKITSILASDYSIYLIGNTSGNLDGLLSLDREYDHYESDSKRGDVFFAKFSSQGEKEWTHLFGSLEQDQASAIANYKDNSFYILGDTYEYQGLHADKLGASKGSFEGQIKLGGSDVFIRKIILDNNSSNKNNSQLNINTSSASSAHNDINISDSLLSSLEDESLYQMISTTSDKISFYPGNEVNFDLIYATSNDQSALTGLSLKIHYDSSLFTPLSDNNGVSALVDTFGDPTVIDDTENFDNDANTDKYISIIWTDFNGDFPGGDLPATLASLSFASSEIGVDSLTGESRINFTSTDPAQGYGFLGQSLILKPQTFNLDIDGDGFVTPLGDGLMVIRKLFGTAFAGDSLTNKAISPDATRTTDEIHAYIEKGIASGVLDVDQDNQTTALGDGLMVIRSLFGATFTGSALTNKAISPDSLYANDERPWEAVAANIDSLMLG